MAGSTITSETIDSTGLNYSTPQAILARAQLMNKGFNIIGDTYNANCNTNLSTAETTSTKLKNISLSIALITIESKVFTYMTSQVKSLKI